MTVEVVTLETYPKLLPVPGSRQARALRCSLLDFLADRDFERATGADWGSMTGLHQRRRINLSLNAERNWT